MKIRILAAVALLPLLLVVVLVLPKICTAILLGIMAAIAAYELLVGTGYVKFGPLVVQACIAAVAVSMLSYCGLPYGWTLLLVLLYAAGLFLQTLISHAKLSFEKVSVSLAAGLLVPYLLTALVRLHTAEAGRFYVLIPFVLAFMSDTGAYFVGIAFGKHKLAPIISPKKTVEGLFGGVAGAMLGMVLFCFVLKKWFSFDVNYAYALVYGFAGSFAAVLGDLGFSVIKRQTGIKDYSHLIPGHGGILDRFDSMTMVAPLVEALMIVLPVVVR